MTFLFGFVCGVAFVPTALLGLAAACDAWSTWTTTDITIAKLLWFLGPRHRWRSARMVHALHAGHALGNASLWAVDGPGVLGWVMYHRAAARHVLSVLPTSMDPRRWWVAFRALFGYGTRADRVTPDTDRAAWIANVKATEVARVRATWQ